MAQRVNLSPIGIPVRKKTFLAKEEKIVRWRNKITAAIGSWAKKSNAAGPWVKKGSA